MNIGWGKFGQSKLDQTILAFSLFVLIAIGVPSASAFMTFPAGNNIHRAILEEGLKPFKLSKASLGFMAKGMDSQDNPFSNKWKIPEHHACDNKIKGAFLYIDARTSKAVELAGRADSDSDACRQALYALGEAMHTIHDFYSHANYVEWLLSQDKSMEPIDRSGSDIPESIRTCYYFYESSLKQEPFLSHKENVRRLLAQHPELTFRSEAEYVARKQSEDRQSALDYALKPGSLLHMELNKDSVKQLEGQVMVGRDGKTLFDLAREIAVKDTTKQWQIFEEKIKAKYGERASAIIAALENAS
ncbi:hypothetical protein KBI23_10675 [bacterium]|nr:hypothetical protein [bacterium]MBP9809338.1 hypothetical protein [bacterium]